MQKTKKHNLCPQYAGPTALILRGGARCRDDQPVSEERRKILMYERFFFRLWTFLGQIVGVAFGECSD